MSTITFSQRVKSSLFSRVNTVPGWSIVIVGAGLLAWLLVLVLMSDMDHGPGTPLHELPVFLAGWVLMLTAMMLPSELNYVGTFAALLVSKGRATDQRRAAILFFMGGYAVVWTVFGLAAYGLDILVRNASIAFLSWYQRGPLVVGGVLIGAGLYQVSPLKEVCLNHCRSPLAFLAHYWKPGKLGALQMGVRHAVVCVGCCWAMMGVMFAVGAMNLVWMALLTVFMFAEKVMPHGRVTAFAIAAILVVMGGWIAVSPDTAPLLKDPLIYGSSICRSIF